MTLKTMLMTYLIEGLARDKLEKPDNVCNTCVTFVQTSLQTCLTQQLPMPMECFQKINFTNSWNVLKI